MQWTIKNRQFTTGKLANMICRQMPICWTLAKKNCRTPDLQTFRPSDLERIPNPDDHRQIVLAVKGAVKRDPL